MDLNSIAQLIGQFGFPVVAACYMGWLCFKQQGTMTEFGDTMKAMQDTLSHLNDRMEHIEHTLEGVLTQGKDYTD